MLAVALCLPIVGSGFQVDDLVHQLVLQERSPLGAGDPLDRLFFFVPNEPEVKASMAALGITPWWSHPELHMAFYRPLSSLTHVVDHAVWPGSPVLQHLHSLFWLGLAVFVVGRLYREIEGPGALAGLAVLLFAVEDAHALPAGWIANRNGLITLVLGAAALLGHARWRRTGRGRDAVLGVLAYGLGLFAGESAIATCAYLFSYQVCLDRRRLAPLLPYALVTVAWRMIWATTGAGAHGSGLYIDPGADPLKFAPVALLRGAWLLGAQWLQLPVSPSTNLPDAAQWGVALGLIALLSTLAVRVWPELRGRPTAAFYALGMSLALVPPTATFPMDRLLTFSGIGAFGLIATLCVGGGHRALLTLHLPVAAALLAGKLWVLPAFGLMAEGVESTLPRTEAVRGQTVVLLSGIEFATAYVPVIRALQQEPAPGAVVLLATASASLHVERPDARTLLVRSPEGWLARTAEQLFRDDTPFRVGERFSRPDHEIEVVEITDDGRPAVVRFTFDRSVDDPHFIWRRMVGVGSVPWTPPPIGAAVDLPAWDPLGDPEHPAALSDSVPIAGGSGR